MSTDTVHHPETLAGDGFAYAGDRAQEDRPHACLDGWVYLGFEREEDGELVEVFDRVRCRRCAAQDEGGGRGE